MKEFVFSQGWWQFLVIAIVCYFIGCINFALIISRKKKNDITKIGSGNPGTMNMTREFGWKVGLLTFLCDLLKGGIPTLVIWLIPPRALSSSPYLLLWVAAICCSSTTRA